MTLNKQSQIAALQEERNKWTEDNPWQNGYLRGIDKALSLAQQLDEEIDKFDYHRVREWALSKPRKPANLAFTAGTNRNAAYLIEELIYSTPAAPIKLPVKLTFLDDESVAEEVARGIWVDNGGLISVYDGIKADSESHRDGSNKKALCISQAKAAIATIKRLAQSKTTMKGNVDDENL